MPLVFTKFDAFIDSFGSRPFALATDVLKVALSDTLPDHASASLLSSIVEIAAGHGYTAGGLVLPNTAFSQAASVDTIAGDAAVFTASGGSIGPFRYVVLYDFTAKNKPLIAFADYGSEHTIADGDSLSIKPNGLATGGTILTVT